MHRLLQRQLARHFGDSVRLPPELDAFVESVDAAYRQSDVDRNLLEHSLDLVSQELMQRHEELRTALRRSEHYGRALLELAHGLVDCADDLEQAVRRLTELVGRALDVRRTSVWVFDDAGGVARCVDLYEHPENRHRTGMDLTLRDSSARMAALASRRLVATHLSGTQESTREYDQISSGLEPATSVLEAAARLGGREVALVRHEHVGPAREWMPEERQFAASVADHLSLLIEASRRVRAEAALEQQRAFLRLVIDLNPSFIFAKDREGRFTLVNQAVADAYGSTVEDLVGKTDADFNPNAEEVAHFRRIDLDVLDTGRERFVAEEVLTDAQGRVRYLQTVKRPIVEADGRANQVLGVSTDISERKRAEEERARLEESLRQAQKIESLGLLAGGIAHDFNNLLTPIICYTQMALQQVTDGALPLSHDLSEVLLAGERGRDLTAQLLAFGRKQVLSLRPLSLNEAVIEAQRMLVRLLPENVRIHMDLTPAIGWVNADPTPIHQVIVNLAINARDAMPDGGVLTLSTSMERDEDGRQVVLEVRDNGTGMAPEVASHIFDPFFTTKPLGKGTGLGLATAHGIVSQHGGTLSMTTRLGHGTTFRIALPELLDVEVARPNQPPAPARRRFETILLVEDEDALNRLVSRLLVARGFTVLAASEAEEATRLAEQHQGAIHLLLTDVVLPGLHGRALYERLVPLRPEMRVLYMSGHPQDILAPHGLNDPGVKLLQKPFTPAELHRMIDSVLEPPGEAPVTGGHGRVETLH